MLHDDVVASAMTLKTERIDSLPRMVRGQHVGRHVAAPMFPTSGECLYTAWTSCIRHITVDMQIC